MSSLISLRFVISVLVVYNSYEVANAKEDSRDTDNSLCPPWYVFNTSNNSCQCAQLPELNGAVICADEGTLLQIGYCMTYHTDEQQQVYGTRMAQCPYLDIKSYNITHTMHILLPHNKTELTKYTCGPMNRKGTACRYCIPGFGPSLTSIGYKCHNCTDVRYGVPLYLVVEFLPLTVFCLIILTFQVSLTTPFMTCFIMCSQFILYDLLTKFPERDLIILQTNSSKLIRAAIALHGVWNLDLIKYILPPFCVSNRLHPLHIIFLNYASAIYPLLLILMSYLAVELHGRNVRLLVYLWRPFHKCCVRLRREWNAKNDIIDTFATFFLLAYSKFMYQSFELLGCQYRYSPNVPRSKTEKVTLFDLDAYCFSRRHLPFAVFSIGFLLFFVVLPVLAILLYPVRVFRTLFSKRRLPSQLGSAIHFFAERFYSSYRDGLDGGRDMRCLSCLFFILMPVIMIHHLVYDIYHAVGDSSLIEVILFFSASLLVALTRPYKDNVYTITNSFMLALLAFRSLFMCLYGYSLRTETKLRKYNYVYAIIILVCTMLPQIFFWAFIILTVLINKTKLVIKLFTTRRYEPLIMQASLQNQR